MMKVLIVDDELHVRNSVRKLVDWQAYGIDTILEAEDVDGAIELIRDSRPQLVITDIMMPLKTGLELMEWLEANAPDCKKIVISGYNDFEYVRKTLKYGGTDYLLKPIDRNQLREAIGKAADSWTESKRVRLQHQRAAMEVNELKPIYRDKIMSKLLAESVPGSEDRTAGLLEPAYKEFPVLRAVQSCLVAVLDLGMLGGSVREKFATNMDLLCYSMINISNEFMRVNDRGVAFRNWNSNYEIVLLLWDELSHSGEIMKLIYEGISKALNARIDLAVSSARPFPSGLRQAYSQAKEMLCRRNLLDWSPRIHEYQESASLLTTTLGFGKFEEEIRLAVYSGQSELIKRSLQKWFDVVATMDHITVDQLEKWQVEFKVVKTRWMEQFFLDRKEGMTPLSASANFVVPLDEAGNLSVASLQQALSDYLTELSQALLSSQARSRNVMLEIAGYIETNYAQDITLTDIASMYYLNREYISRKFKQEFQETVIDYLSRVRVEKAKLLLRNPHIRIVQVAQMVGYQDEKYFSRVFKKLEGNSPKEYRNQGKQLAIINLI